MLGALLLNFSCAELVDVLPEALLGWALAISLVVFAVAMFWRTRERLWWYPEPRGH
jgi:hypothetical protein